MDYAVVYFLPWMRRGLASALRTGTDEDGIPTGALPVVTAGVSVGSERISRDIALQGPASVRGLTAGQVLRCFPTPDSAEFERNDFVHVELATPDLPWLFTPGGPNADRLLPWLVLVVVEERAGVSLSAGDPLPVLRIDQGDRELPPLQQAFAWVHVQCDADVAAGVSEVFAADPGAFRARLIAARRLRGGAWYRACVVPSFGAGRDAGLGRTPAAGDASLAWTAGARDVELPVYYSWRFRTSERAGDFESLVSQLKPRTLPGQVGMHALDVSDPGSAELRHPGATTSYLGAFLSPRIEPTTWAQPARAAFERTLQRMLNTGLVEPGEQAASSYDPLRDDPVVAPPVYGAAASAVDRVGAFPDGWLTQANLDPAQRSVAGLGADVVRAQQEPLMAEAWRQAAAVREANALLNRSRLALEVGKRLARRVAALDDGRWLQWSRAAHGRLKPADRDLTLHGELAASALPHGLVSAAFRRRLRPGTPLSRAIAIAAPSPTASFAGPLTSAFVSDTRGMLGYAHFTRPPGAVVKGGVAARGAGRARAALRTRAGAAGAAELAAMIDRGRLALDPERLLRARVRHAIRSPRALGDAAVPAALRVDPQFRTPLSAALVRRDPELLMPGVGRLPDDTVGLARLNTAFVEAFLLGANLELGREFLWREFPADPSGTWLRTFWDALGPSSTSADVSPVAEWKPASALGSHGSLDPEQTLVLIVKSELLRRYPATQIYAVPAQWAQTDRGAWERVEDTTQAPVYPVLCGTLGADVSFLGFSFPPEVRVDADLVGSATPPARPASPAQPGWFFAFEQQPEAPHFGLDVGRDSQAERVPLRWEQLSWVHVTGASESAYVDLGALIEKAGGQPPRLPYDDRGWNADWTETWAESSAAMARITWQRPVRVLLHADQMLRPAAPASRAERS